MIKYVKIMITVFTLLISCSVTNIFASDTNDVIEEKIDISENIIDIVILIIMSAVVWAFAWSKKKLVRWHGVVMLVSYVVYLAYICIR